MLLTFCFAELLDFQEGDSQILSGQRAFPNSFQNLLPAFFLLFLTMISLSGLGVASWSSMSHIVPYVLLFIYISEIFVI